MTFLLSHNKKIFIVVATLALFIFSIYMITFQDHGDISFGTQASVLHTTSAVHDSPPADLQHADF